MIDQQDMILEQLIQLDKRHNKSIHSLSLRVDEGDIASRAQIDILSASYITLRAEVNTKVSIIKAELSAVLADFNALGDHFDTLNVTALSAISQLDSITTSLTKELSSDRNTYDEALSDFRTQLSRLSSDTETRVSSRLDVQSSRLNSLSSRIDSTNKRIDNYHSSGHIPRPIVVSILITLVTAFLSRG